MILCLIGANCEYLGKITCVNLILGGDMSSVADTVFPWVILVLFVATTYAGYFFGRKNRDKP